MFFEKRIVYADSLDNFVNLESFVSLINLPILPILKILKAELNGIIAIKSNILSLKNNSLFFEMISLEIKSIVKNINKELSMYINIPLNPFIISIVAIMTATTEKISIK